MKLRIAIVIGVPVCAVLLALFYSVPTAFSQSTETKELCQSLDAVDEKCQELSRNACQTLLEECRSYYETRAEEYKQTVQQKEARERTFEEQVAHFDSRIQRLDTLIQRNRVEVRDLNYQIEDTTQSIQQTEQKINDNKEYLRRTLQLIYEKDRRSTVEVLLSGESFASFFANVAALQSLQTKNRKVLREVEELHSSLIEQKKKLAREKESLQRVVIETQLRREESKELKQRKQELLTQVRGEKQQYEQYLETAKEKAAEIRQRIFELAQVPTKEAPTLEEAYQFAALASQKTSVRPALLLGLFSVESAIGKNVGQCNCAPSDSCRHPDVSWQDVMRESQWSYFKTVTDNLGLDRSTTPVSCSIDGGQVQWGGAMGPGQFMPSTWMRYKDTVKEKIGEEPDPWNIKHAFVASATYLSDFGANSQRYEDEIGAVTAYLCGTTRMTSRCRQARGEQYRAQVMEKASKFQDYIDRGILQK